MHDRDDQLSGLIVMKTDDLLGGGIGDKFHKAVELLRQHFRFGKWIQLMDQSSEYGGRTLKQNKDFGSGYIYNHENNYLYQKLNHMVHLIYHNSKINDSQGTHQKDQTRSTREQIDGMTKIHFPTIKTSPIKECLLGQALQHSIPKASPSTSTLPSRLTCTSQIKRINHEQ